MTTRKIILITALALALGACGDDDPEIQNNTTGNNTNANNTSGNNTTGNNTTGNNTTGNNTTGNNTTGNNTTGNNTTGNNGNPLTCSGDFGAADACGGDPVGTWTITEGCTNFDYEGTLRQACDDAVVENTEVNVTGSLTIDATNFAQAVTGDITLTMSSATGCGLGNCSLVETALGVVAESATCTDDGSGGCDCTATFDAGSASTGTYTTDAGVATLGTGETYYYCASGGTLLLREFGTSNDDAQPTFLYAN